MASRRKVTITIDDDLAQALERAGNLSAQLDDLDRTDGALPDDPDEDARIERLPGGTA